MSKLKVLVTGAHGQVGQALQEFAKTEQDIEFYFFGSVEADITNPDNLREVFTTVKPQYCINMAAYTAVDKAESDSEKAYLINENGAANLAEACKNANATLLHLSTDFVFSGTKTGAYTEQDSAEPVTVYGKSKLAGEQAVKAVLKEHYIIRTAWVYSQFGHNFMKTMLRLATERDTLTIVNDQYGTPTNANDLAQALVHIIKNDNGNYGVYHYSNEGETTWYGFAKQIFEVNNIAVNVQPVPSSAFSTPAKRPQNSVLDKSAIKKNFGLHIKPWKESLASVKLV